MKTPQFRASYGTKLHYQRLAIESRKAWALENEKRGLLGYDVSGHDKANGDNSLFVKSGMLRVQSSDHLDLLEEETLANMTRDGLRDTQFVQSKPADCDRAHSMGWQDKLLSYEMPHQSSQSKKKYEAVLDSLAGFIRCSTACAYYQKIAAAKGVEFCFGPQEGALNTLVKEESTLEPGKKKVSGLRTKDGKVHTADTVVVAGEFHQVTRHIRNSTDTRFNLNSGVLLDADSS